MILTPLRATVAENPLFFLVLGILFLCVVLVISHAIEQFFSKKSTRHRNYYKTAERILKKLPSLSNDGSRLNYLRQINPYVFEELLLLAFKKQGFKVKCNKSYSGDGGVDGKVWIEGKCYLIQAKRYSQAINPKHIEEFGKVLQYMNCEGFFIHTGRTGEKSIYHSINYPIYIISGERLLNLLTGNFIFQSQYKNYHERMSLGEKE
ncbi:restriction endonuclease [Xenorhabdus cabanillasii]|uniref:Membrane protein n=1 Tax=Xenorhabdus cabanillasii JM26 TaxID=1427517 RepID=W1INI0_9GAMM|nr:restriction endonuclease [Xenorhabdus cabanillasii]PHM75909.1 restriction endonuclease [Xenorhabdus cabanillasii JM26]CDL79979.1 putative membrane protein [Xenorhabdus cabanillasii JM26]